MTNQRIRTGLVALAALLAVGLVAAGCSSTDDDAIPPLESTASSDPTSTTVEDTTTSTSVTTTTVETTTTETETTLRPELDPANWDSDLDEIYGRYLLFWQALDIAFGPPEANPDYGPLAELTGPEALADYQAEIRQDYIEAGHVLVVSEDSLEEHVLRLPRPTALDKTEGNEVIIQDCWIADRTKESLDGETVETWSFPTLFNTTMKVIDGEWRLFANVIASSEGSDGWDECNAYFADLDK